MSFFENKKKIFKLLSVNASSVSSIHYSDQIIFCQKPHCQMNSSNFMRAKYFFKLDTDKFILKCFDVNQLYVLLLIFDILQMMKECFPQMTRNVT